MDDFVLNAKCQVSPTDTDKLVDMEETLVLLKIFDKIGDKLTGLLRVDLRAFYIGKRYCSSVVAEALIQAAGFDVKPKTVNSNNSSTRGSAIEFATKKADLTTVRNSFVPKPPPCILGTVRRLSSVAVSPLSLRSVPMPVTKLLLQHLVKKRDSKKHV